jgi:hypothetical protein
MREEHMTIGNAVQRGNYVFIYDEKRAQTGMVSAGTGPQDGLKGYTSSTVNIRNGNYIFSYDDRGRQLSMTSAA